MFLTQLFTTLSYYKKQPIISVLIFQIYFDIKLKWITPTYNILQACLQKCCLQTLTSEYTNDFVRWYSQPPDGEHTQVLWYNAMQIVIKSVYCSILLIYFTKNSYFLWLQEKFLIFIATKIRFRIIKEKVSLKWSFVSRMKVFPTFFTAQISLSYSMFQLGIKIPWYLRCNSTSN